MPGIHKNPTLAFRPSAWERALIEERAAMSGMLKKDFISRSCIYSNVVVVGKKETVQAIVDIASDMIDVFDDIARQISSGDIEFSEEIYYDIRDDVLATAITVLDILNGASYLFDKEKKPVEIDYKAELERLKRIRK